MEAKIYVGTYKKYNEGDLTGSWIDLTELSEREDFDTACKVIHSDETDAELMYQDTNGILSEMPKDWISESSIDDKVFEFITAYQDDETQGEAFLKWLKICGYTGDFHYLQTQFEESYEGEYESEEAFGEHAAEEMGYYAAMEKAGINASYFDVESYTRDLFLGDYHYSEGSVYRNL